VGAWLTKLAEETNAHLLLDVGALEHLLELLEGDEVVLVGVGLHDGPLRDGDELLLADVGTNHHGEDGEELLLGDAVVAVEVVHPEGESKLLLAPVELVFFDVLLQWPEVREDADEVGEVHPIADVVFIGEAAVAVFPLGAVPEESVHDSVTQRVDSQLWYP